MPLQFIFGPSGSGKSYKLYRQIIEDSMRYPTREFIVLVPEQFTMQTQKDLVSMHPRKGIMNIDILSFARLAYRVFEETGGEKLPVLDDEGKNLILRKIAGEYEPQLKVLRGNIKKLGYISEVKSVISEFTQYDIGEEEIDAFMETLGKESRLYYKLQDIKLLYKGFTDYLEKKYITKEELLDVLARKVKESKILKNSTVVLDGFTGFTPVQNRLLKELMLHCRDVMITATIDRRENPYIYRTPYQLFALSKQMVTGLVQIAKDNRIEVKEPVWCEDEPVYRFRDNASMAFLEKNLFRYTKEVYVKEQDEISIHVARNPKEEALALAGNMRALVRSEGLRYRDIGVIVSNIDMYGDVLERAFSQYEIPVFMDHKRNILQNPYIEYIRSLLNLVDQNFSYESVFRFLRTNLSGFTWDEVDTLENYCIGLGIKGYKRWQEKWIRRLSNTKEEELEKLNHLRVAFVEKLDEFVFVLKQRKKTVKDITLAVYEFMVKEELQLKIKKQEEEFQKSGELALAKEYAQIYRIVIELFDKFVELLGDEEVGISEYCKLLDAGLEEARVGVIPPGIDQVTVGDMERTRLKDIKVLYLIGANDVYIPGSLMRTGLLTEKDREKFKNNHLMLSPGGKEKAYTQKFYLYMNLTKPSEKLRIFYSKVSNDGKSLRPSYLVQDFQKMYPKMKIQDEEEKEFAEKELTKQQGIDYLIQGLRKNGRTMNSVWQELYTWYKKSPDWQEKVEHLVEAGYIHKSFDGLTREIAEKLYGENFQKSITRMERYAACAFAHFLTYGLRLSEREEYEFEAVDMGNVCHGALEHYARKIEHAGYNWTNVPETLKDTCIEESISEAITDYGNSVLYSSARNENMIRRMKVLVERSIWAITKQISQGDFVPSAYEMRFANGKVDRIDTCEDEDNVYVKVTDYKTGRKSLDITLLYHGLQLQLMVYMDMAMQMEKKKHPGKEIVPAGVFYYHLDDPFVDKQEKETIERAILKELRPDGLINSNGEVLKHLDHTLEKDSVVIPVKYNKDGSLSKSSKVVNEVDFHLMMNHALKKVEEAGKAILDGETKVLPYRRGDETGCDYCKYKHVCGFDIKIPGYEYRDIDKMSNEEVLESIREDFAEENGKGEE